ncbi:MAG: hypothetical protein AB1429_11435 [Pseudomonadota bacterium]|mgnify:CR=1 FL=1|jgi:hypothetical protein
MRWLRDRWGGLHAHLSQEEARQGDEHTENQAALNFSLVLVCIVFAVLFVAVWLSR